MSEVVGDVSISYSDSAVMHLKKVKQKPLNFHKQVSCFINLEESV